MVRIVNKKKFIRGISIIAIGLAVIIMLIVMIIKGIIFLFTPKENDTKKVTSSVNYENTVSVATLASTPPSTNSKNAEILEQWNLKLVNKDNSVDRSYVPELEEIDDGIKFDKRAISYLKSMINAMYKDGITKPFIFSSDSS